VCHATADGFVRQSANRFLKDWNPMNDQPTEASATRPSERVAIVTGAARRIGAAIVRALHADGARVLIHCHQSVAQAEMLAEELCAQRADSAAVICADLLDPAAPQQIIAAALDRWQRLDALVNNASSFYPTPLETLDLSQWHELLGSNLVAPVFLAQAAAPALRESGGCIVNLLDMNLQRTLPDHPAYLAAKGGLAALTRSLALDLAPQVRVNGIAPGAILPAEEESSARWEKVVRETPLARPGAPADIAQAVCFFTRAPFVTGQILAVDGGRSL
jgi:pteridine reductase